MTSNNNTIISHTDKTSTSSKKEQFLSDLKNWREKYSDVLK